jgi:hypothetical protein
VFIFERLLLEFFEATANKAKYFSDGTVDCIFVKRAIQKTGENEKSKPLRTRQAANRTIPNCIRQRQIWEHDLIFLLHRKSGGKQWRFRPKPLLCMQHKRIMISV